MAWDSEKGTIFEGEDGLPRVRVPCMDQQGGYHTITREALKAAIRTSDVTGFLRCWYQGVEIDKAEDAAAAAHEEAHTNLAGNDTPMGKPHRQGSQPGQESSWPVSSIGNKGEQAQLPYQQQLHAGLAHPEAGEHHGRPHCTFCGRVGHWDSWCYRKDPSLRPQSPGIIRNETKKKGKGKGKGKGKTAKGYGKKPPPRAHPRPPLGPPPATPTQDLWWEDHEWEEIAEEGEEEQYHEEEEADPDGQQIVD